jgi:hypothetical protein
VRTSLRHFHFWRVARRNLGTGGPVRPRKQGREKKNRRSSQDAGAAGESLGVSGHEAGGTGKVQTMARKKANRGTMLPAMEVKAGLLG